MPYFVYILRCGDDSLYTGITTSLSRRLAEHKSGKGAKYTASRGALHYECAWQAPNKSSALRLEARIKLLKRAKKEALLRGEEPQSLCLENFNRLCPEEMARAE